MSQESTDQPEPTATDPAPAPAPTAAHGAFVRVMIVITALLTISMVGLLTFRWLTTDEPTSYIQVDGDEALEGVEIRVEGASLQRPMMLTLSKPSEYHARFFVQPGRYAVHITRYGRELRTSSVDLYAQQYMEIDLRGVDLSARSRPGKPQGGKP